MHKTVPNVVVSRAAGRVRQGQKKILVLHGPNLNLLGTREPEIYGRETLPDINRRLVAQGKAAGVSVICFQSNHEGDLIDRVQRGRRDETAFVLINPAGLTHSSVALRDAMAAAAIPYVEVHLSNIHAREPFRHHSYFSDQAIGTICGLGSRGYDLALQFILQQL